MNQTTELTFCFRVPGSGIASALTGLALAAQIEKLLSENGCVLQLGHIYPHQSNPVTGETGVAAEPDKSPEPETPAPAEATPAPEPEKPKRTRTPKESPPAAKAQEPEAPLPQPEPEKQPEAPQATADPANGIICCEKLASIHRTGRSAAAAAFMPQWNGVTEAITAAGYSGVTAIKAALGVPETAAQAAADVTAILSKCEESLAELEATIAAKKAKADADEDGLD